MYAVEIPPAGDYKVAWWLFFRKDPRLHGCQEAVRSDVTFTDLPMGAGSSSEARARVLAESADGTAFKVFRREDVPSDYRRHEFSIPLEFSDWRSFVEQIGGERGYRCEAVQTA